jgi:hypothetical protein
MVPRRVFREFFCGRSGNDLVVAQLRFEIGLFIAAKTTNVRMEKSYAVKMMVKHRLTYEQLYMVQASIDEGFCFEGKNRSHLEFVYFPNRPGAEPYMLVLKSALGGAEIWFVTLYKLRRKQYERMRKTQRLLWPPYSKAG